MNRSRHAVQFTLLCFFSLLLFVTGCRKPNARITAGHGSASIEAPNQLLTVLAISNEGSAPAEDIQITSISTPGAALTVPPSLPVSLGTLAPEADSDLDANFTLASPKPDNTYSITLAGTFREDGHRFKFSLTEDVRTPPASPGSGTSLKGTAPSNHVTGAPYPPQKPNFGSEVNEGGEGRRVPTGPKRPLVPSKESNVQSAPKGSGGGGGGGTASINFPTNAPVGINSSTTAEPSGASGGGVIFETANWYAAYSTDGGTSFTKLDPTTIFPNTTDGGFCCDQVVQYVPSIDRFVWVMQYGPASPAPTPNPKNLPTNGPGLYRVASASPAEVKSSKGTGWSYFDITSQAVLESANTPWLDYPDTSFGNTYLYLSADDVNNGGHVVVRISLADIKAGGTINFGYTKPSDSGVAWGGHLSQNTGDTIYWAGHNNSSSIRVFDWPESSNNYSWRDISIGSWPNTSSSNLMTSTTPDGLDWLNKMSGFPGNAVLGLARSATTGDNKRTNQLILAWTGAIGSGFKQPQVQWIALDLNNNYKLISQQQVWNSGYAYAYPAFAVDSRNEIGMSLEWGGGGNYENHVAGFWGDYVVYSTTNSAIGTKRFGDYVTIRNNSADATRFDAFGYGLNKDSSGNAVSDVHYLIFSR
jgi:hypothetical protein